MTGEGLRAAIQALLASHPSLSISSAGHAKHAHRFLSAQGFPVGFEPRTVRFQNLWVRADSVRAQALSDLTSRPYPLSGFSVSKPNHDLFGEEAFKDADLICFKVTDIWQAVRVISEVAGLGEPT